MNKDLEPIITVLNKESNIHCASIDGVAVDGSMILSYTIEGDINLFDARKMSIICSCVVENILLLKGVVIDQQPVLWGFYRQSPSTTVVMFRGNDELWHHYNVAKPLVSVLRRDNELIAIARDGTIYGIRQHLPCVTVGYISVDVESACIFGGDIVVASEDGTLWRCDENGVSKIAHVPYTPSHHLLATTDHMVLVSRSGHHIVIVKADGSYELSFESDDMYFIDGYVDSERVVLCAIGSDSLFLCSEHGVLNEIRNIDGSLTVLPDGSVLRAGQGKASFARKYKHFYVLALDNEVFIFRRDG